jgi:predicted nucleotidyltransferase
MVAMNDIQAVVDRIAEVYDPECVVLFGSHARGTATSDSDVDLLVILAFEGKPFWKSLEITNRVNPPFAVDLLARRPDDTQRRYAQGDPLIREALDQGRVLYERRGARVVDKAEGDYRLPLLSPRGSAPDPGISRVSPIAW